MLISLKSLIFVPPGKLFRIFDLVLWHIQVRKRPLNRKELSRKEEDIIDVHDLSSLTVYEPKLKVSTTRLHKLF
jgi:hypothetical protein